MRTWHVVALVLVALVLGTSFAHVLQWPAKLQYDGALYTLAGLLRHERPAFLLVVAAAGALLLAFPVIFYWRVEPANVVFRTAGLAGAVPKDWAAWRARWETGHALRFVLHLVVFVLLAS